MSRQKGACNTRVSNIFYFSHSDVYGGDLNDVIEYIDLTFVLKGSLRYVIDGKEVDISEKTAVFFPHGSHRIRINSDSAEVEYISFNFTAYPPLRFPRVIENCVTDDICDLLKLLERIYMGHSSYQEEILLMIFQSLLFTLDDVISINMQNPHIERILSYIDANFTEKISLESLADAVHLAPHYCSNIIKKELGVTFSEIVMQKRMQYAKNLIFKKDKTLIEIAHICGYNHYGYFVKCFKKIYGSNPSDVI